MNRLRNLLLRAGDLSQPMSYFLDHLATDPVFLQQSVPGDPDLDVILQALGHYVLGLGHPLGTRRFFRNGQLWHGCCTFGAAAATVLYHVGLDIGLLAIPLEDQHATIRFTLLPFVTVAGAEQPAN